jgi:hypothetical protein
MKDLKDTVQLFSSAIIADRQNTLDVLERMHASLINVAEKLGGQSATAKAAVVRAETIEMCAKALKEEWYRGTEKREGDEV